MVCLNISRLFLNTVQHVRTHIVLRKSHTSRFVLLSFYMTLIYLITCTRRCGNILVSILFSPNLEWRLLYKRETSKCPSCKYCEGFISMKSPLIFTPYWLEKIILFTCPLINLGIYELMKKLWRNCWTIKFWKSQSHKSSDLLNNFTVVRKYWR